jgi:RNA polymerase sigma factor (sigma-70 family)
MDLTGEPTSALREGVSVEDFDHFFRRVFPRAVSVARRVTGEVGSAEDAALEALAKAHYRWKRVGAAPWRELWVLRVAVNEALDSVPKVRDLPRVLDTKDPADEVVLRQTLRAALKALSRRQREVVVLRYLVGLSETEVATALHLSPGTVKTHLRRGMSTLRGTVGRNLEEEHLARIA